MKRLHEFSCTRPAALVYATYVASGTFDFQNPDTECLYQGHFDQGSRTTLSNMEQGISPAIERTEKASSQEQKLDIYQERKRTNWNFYLPVISSILDEEQLKKNLVSFTRAYPRTWMS